MTPALVAASVNVGGLVASTLSLSDADFLAGKRSFSGGGTQGNIGNEGRLPGRRPNPRQVTLRSARSQPWPNIHWICRARGHRPAKARTPSARISAL